MMSPMPTSISVSIRKGRSTGPAASCCSMVISRFGFRANVNTSLILVIKLK